MFGRNGIKLVSELDECTDVPPFNESVVKDVLTEMQGLYDANVKDGITMRNEENPELLSTIQFRHVSLNRNKRCLLAYIYNRMERLREVRWELGSIIPPEIRENLVNAEVQWFQAYNKSLATYMKSIGDDYGFDITSYMVPPKSPFIEVKCLVDFGKLELDDGQVVTLKKNTYHLLPRTTCEPLIRQGILEHQNP